MKKYFYRVCSLMIIAALLLALLPCLSMPCTAAAPRSNALDLTAISSDDANIEQGWSWNAEAKELTLNGLSLTCTAETALRVPDGTNIIVTGRNYVKSINSGSSADSHSFGIRCDGAVTFSGDGSITATGSGAYTNYGICCEGKASISFTEKAIVTAIADEATSASLGIYCAGPVLLSDTASVEAVGGKGQSLSRGLAADGLITVTNGTLKARSSRVYSSTGLSYGVYAGKGIIVSDGTVVAASDTQNYGGTGLYVFTGTAQIDGGDVTVRGGLKAFHKTPSFDQYSSARVTLVGNDVTGKDALAWNRYSDITNYKYVRLMPYDPAGGLTCSDWAKAEIIRASVQGIIPSCLAGKDLREDITRQEFAAVAVKTFEILAKTKATVASENPFRDCDDPEVLKAYKLGITEGTSATTFQPDIVLTRETAATMLTRSYMIAKNVPELRFSMPVRFADDQNISPWAYDSVYFMATKGVIKGGANNMFMPRALTVNEKAEGYGNTTRQEALLIALRMVETFGIV